MVKQMNVALFQWLSSLSEFSFGVVDSDYGKKQKAPQLLFIALILCVILQCLHLFSDCIDLLFLLRALPLGTYFGRTS